MAHNHPPSDTIEQLLRAARGYLHSHSASPRLDAEVLLMHVLGRDRTWLRTWPEHPPSPTETQRFRFLLERRREGAPIAYLTGEREFWSRSFSVRPGVLIPRPETELLIELALHFISADHPAAILDLGTGSGIIAVTLAVERPLAQLIGVDLSPEALVIARENAERHRAGNLCLLRGDWFTAIAQHRGFDLVISNPPYIAAADPHLQQGDLRFEPKLALQSGPTGLDALTGIAREARLHIRSGGRLLLEHGYDQAEPLYAILAGFGYADITHHRDLQRHRRATSAVCP